MPTVILKTAPDRDHYAMWSTVVDGPTAVGDRAEMLRRLTVDMPAGFSPRPGYAPEDRLRRADETGTSAAYGLGAFTSPGLVVDGRWWLPRERLADYSDAVMRNDETAARALLEDPDTPEF